MIIDGGDVYGCFINELKAAHIAHIAHNVPFDYSAGIILKTNNRYVLVHQIRSKYENFPKGRIKPLVDGNNPMRAAEREFMEETGVKINISEVPKIVFRVGKCIYFIVEIDINIDLFRGVKNRETNAVICVDEANLRDHAFKERVRTSYSFRACVTKILQLSEPPAPSFKFNL